MPVKIRDIYRLFIEKVNFVAGSKKRQMGYLTDTKQIALNNQNGDGIIFEVSEDALQCLLAGTQTLSGDKTFTLPIKLASNGSIGANANDIELKQTATGELKIIHSDSGDVSIQCGSGDFVIKAGTLLQLWASTLSKAPLNILSGVAPGSPAEGDIWKTATDLIARVNGVSESLLANASTHMLLTGPQSADGLKNFNDGIRASIAGLGFAPDSNVPLLVSVPANEVGSPLEVLRVMVEDVGNPVDTIAGIGPLISFYIPNSTAPVQGGYISCEKTAGSDSSNAARLVFATTPEGGVATRRMFIDENGNVGIGVASPGFNLDVNGNGKFIDDLSVDSRNNPDNAAYLLLNADRTTDGFLSGSIAARNNSTEIGEIRFYRGSTDAKGDISFRTSDVERVRIDEDGDLFGFGAANITGVGPHSFGRVPFIYSQFVIGGTFTSGGSAVATGLHLATILTAVNGNTSYISLQHIDGSIVTQNNSETIGKIASLRIEEPGITKGSDTVTEASTLLIIAAPTEGAENWALKIDSGNVSFPGDLNMGGPVLFGSDASIGLNSNVLEIKALSNNDLKIIHTESGDIVIDCSSGDLRIAGGSLVIENLKTGATQIGAGAAAGELWATASHATLPDNVVLIGV